MTANVKEQIIHDFSPGRSGRMDALLESAGRLGEEAKQAALKRVVNPTLKVARQASDVIEERARQTTALVHDQFGNLQERALAHPRRTLGYVFGAGLILGLLLQRRR